MVDRPHDPGLAVVHNVTAATRLLDVAELVGGDLRVHTRFTVPPYSAFVGGTERFLGENGIRPLPWDVSVSRRWDLAVAASHGGDLRKLDTLRMIIPHGMGYIKYLPRSQSSVCLPSGSSMAAN